MSNSIEVTLHPNACYSLAFSRVRMVNGSRVRAGSGGGKVRLFAHDELSFFLPRCFVVDDSNCKGLKRKWGRNKKLSSEWALRVSDLSMLTSSKVGWR